MFGFNGMEKTNEIYGEGNEYTTEFRQYDPRIGRWMSPDPAMSKYPSWSPYVFAFDNPIFFNDPRGDDPPTIQQIIEMGKLSATFRDLLIINNITNENLENIIKYASRTGVYPGVKGGQTIVQIVKVEDIYLAVINLTHELSNLSQIDNINSQSSQVERGDISPAKYADNLMRIEAKSSSVRFIVAAELNLSKEQLETEFGEGAYETADIWRKGQITREALESGFLKVAYGSTVTNEFMQQENAPDYYVRQGQDKRNDYLENFEDQPIGPRMEDGIFESEKK